MGHSAAVSITTVDSCCSKSLQDVGFVEEKGEVGEVEEDNDTVFRETVLRGLLWPVPGSGV